MITCYLRYEIDPFKTREFETYGKMWIPLVNRLGGTHHGYFLPQRKLGLRRACDVLVSLARSLCGLSGQGRRAIPSARRLSHTAGRRNAF